MTDTEKLDYLTRWYRTTTDVRAFTEFGQSFDLAHAIMTARYYELTEGFALSPEGREVITEAFHWVRSRERLSQAL